MTDLVVGDVVSGRYRIEDPLGAGGAGVVYRARDLALERSVALKFQVAGQQTNASHERLRREAAALASLRHENVGAIYSFEVHDGRPFIAMEHVSGRSLYALLHERYEARQSVVPIHRGLQVLAQLCDGLSAVHAAGIVHRDVKPDNVIIEDHTGRVVLVDFGAAVVPGTWDGLVTGTVEYMAPEALLGATPSPAGDLYSLACLAFELMTGELPFEADSWGATRQLHLGAAPPRASARRPALAPLDQILGALLSKQPELRPTSAAIVRRVLDDAMREAAEMSLPSPNVGPSRPTRPSAGDAPPERSRPSVPPATAPGARPGLHVLVVDDDTTFARVAGRSAELALAEVRVRVTFAVTGAEALESARRGCPDLIILDYLLPDTNGVDVLSRIRARRDAAQPEVLLASGIMGASERWRFDILGVCDFVDKPVEIPELVRAIQRLAVRRGWLRPVPVAP